MKLIKEIEEYACVRVRFGSLQKEKKATDPGVDSDWLIVGDSTLDTNHHLLLLRC